MPIFLADLRARVRELADMSSTSFVQDTRLSLDAFINVGVQKLWDKVLDAMGDDSLGRASSAVAITIASGTGTQALPSDFYRMLGVDLLIGGDRVDLRRFEWKQRNSIRTQSLWLPREVPQYCLDGITSLRLNGMDGSYAGTLWYSPTPTFLLNDSDFIDVPNGWEQYAVLYAAILALTKEESDTSGLKSLLGEEGQRIESAAARRHQGSPPRMVDVEVPFTDGSTPWEV